MLPEATYEVVFRKYNWGWSGRSNPQIIETILGNHPADLNLLVALLKKSPIHTSCVLPNLCNSRKNNFLLNMLQMEHQKNKFFFTVFFVHRIVLFCGFLRAPNRAFFWFSSCTKSCFFCALFMHQIVLFLCFLRAPNRAFFWFSSCTKSCFFVVFFVHQTVPQFMLFFLMILLHTPNRALVRAFLSFSSCTKSCFFLVFFVHQVVLFSGFLRAPNRAFLRFSSCTKWCPTSCHCYRG